MQFSAEEEDTDFLTPGSSRARLSSLFESETRSSDINQALTFTAPKQPKKNEVAQEALKLIHAAAVNAFKLIEGSYSSQGKLGCAILGLHETHYYKILLYKGKQVPVTSATITPNFILQVQPNNYVNFYDDKKENWSINFDSEAALAEFIKHVALTRANSQAQGQHSLICQDLNEGEGLSLENGDSVEVKYTGWLLSNFTFGSVFDSNMNAESSFRLKLGKSKVIKGWHEGLIGIKKGGKRLLIVPPELAYGPEGIGSTVPPNSTLIFEVHAVKLKTSRDASQSPSPAKTLDAAPEKKPDIPQKPPLSSQDENIRRRGASISEQLSQSPKKDKAQLISRMAKMGMATLPFSGAIAAHVSSDSEPEADHSLPSSRSASRTASPKPTGKPRSRRSSEKSVTDSTSVVNAQAAPPSQGSVSYQLPSQALPYDATVMHGQPSGASCVTPYQSFPAAPYQAQLPAQYAMLQSSFQMQNVPGMIPTSMADTHLPMLINETRNQNMEVRLSLSKLTDKVDTVLTKVDDLQLKERSYSTNVPFMEGSVLLQNLQRIIQENTRLTSDIEAKNAKIESLNEKICDLFQRNQRFFEESSSMLEKKNDSLENVSMLSQEKILNLEQEKIKLQLELSSASMKLNALEENLSDSQSKLKEVQRQLEEAQSDAKLHKDLLKTKDESVISLQSEISQLSLAMENLKSLEEEKALLLAKIEGLEHAQSSSQNTDSLIEMYKKEIEQYKGVSDQLRATLCDKSKLEEDIKALHKEIDEKSRTIKEVEAKYTDTLKKYENLHEKSLALKERYDLVVKELKSLRSLQISPDFSAEIKKVMNALYKMLQSKFEADTSYSGSQVLDTVLQTIMSLTFQILERKNKSAADQSSLPESPKYDKDNTPKDETDTHSEQPPTQNGQADLEAAESLTSSSAISSERTSSQASEVDAGVSNVEKESSNELLDNLEAADEVNTSGDTKEEAPAEKSQADSLSGSSEPVGKNSSVEAKRESPENKLLSNSISEQTSSGSLGAKV